MKRENIDKKRDINNLEEQNKILASNSLEQSIKNLQNPSFLGSFHLNSNIYHQNNSFKKMMEESLQNKTNQSIKNVIFNPLTKILLILTIVFNIFYFALTFLL